MMKFYVFFFLVLVTPLIFGQQSFKPINRNASPEVKQLLKKLYKAKGEYIISGQHNYGHHMDKWHTYVKRLTGKSPLIWGADFSRYYKEEVINSIVSEAIKRNKDGYIVTLMWYTGRSQDNPPFNWGNSTQGELTKEEWIDLTTSGTLLHKKWETRVDLIICPSGGYWVLAYDWEGSDIAKNLNARGIVGIVLKYRLPTSNNNNIRYKSPLLDAKRAMRLVRHQVKEWDIDSDKIGIMGFSARGHLASTLSTHFDYGNKNSKDQIEQVSCRPDFSILIYPVISFVGDFASKETVNALLGTDSSDKLKQYFSNQLQVKKETPPTFLVHSSDDKTIHVNNSLIYYKALQKYSIQSKMHFYPYGGHGYSLTLDKGHLSSWMDRCTDWIKYITNSRIK